MTRSFIIFSIIAVLLGIGIGTWLGLRSRQAPTSSPPAITAQPSTQELYLPSREYVEARAKAFKQLREELLKAQFSRMNSNKSGVPYSY